MEQNSTIRSHFGDHNTKMRFSFEVLLIAAATAFIAYLQLRKRGKKGEKSYIDISSLPGPKSFIPYVGNSLELIPLSRTLSTFDKWCKQYGPLIKFHKAGVTYVILNSPSALQALFKSNHPGHIVKCPDAYKEISVYIPNGLLTAKGQDWKTKRKIMTQGLSIQGLKNCMPKLTKHCLRLVDNMKLLFKDGKPHTIYDVCSGALFDIIAEFVTGIDVYGKEEGITCHKLLLETEAIVTEKTFRPWITFPLIWKFHPFSKRQKEFLAIKKEWCQNIINRRRQDRLGESENLQLPSYAKSTLDHLLDSDLTDEQIGVEIVVLFSGGHDTSAAAIHFFCFLMALYPEYQTQCRQEINSVIGNRQELEWDDVNKLCFLEQCISETLRLYPAIPVMARMLEAPLVLEDNRVLGTGTQVLILPFTMHRNPEYYPNPNTFDPSRFTPENIAKRPPASYIPFSMGQRNCIGLKFAMVELKLMAAYLLRNFEFSTQHFIDEISVVYKVILKAERDYIFSCKILS